MTLRSYRQLKYDSRLGAMSVSRPLVLDLTYPFDWGFVPSTRGEDGDPLDAMLLWDVASYPGVVIECRAIAVMQVEQNKVNHDPSERIRNDRIMAVPVSARREHALGDLIDLPERLKQELEEFASASVALEGKDIRVLGWGDSVAALAMVQNGARGGAVD